MSSGALFTLLYFKMNVSCNVCHKTLEGPAARTDCCHCFCISCATKAFSDNCICPICKSRLQSGNVAEILVGVVPMSVSDCLFQTAFQSTSWDHVISNMQIINRSVCEFTSFIEFQMLLRATHDNQSKHTLQNHAEAAKTELVRSYDFVIQYTHVIGINVTGED